jgi:Mor family transcriptional regulator
MSPRPRKLTDAQIAQARAQHAAGRTLSSLAADYGVSPATLSRALDTSRTAARDAAIRAAYAAGTPATELARHYRLHRSRIYQIIHT